MQTEGSCLLVNRKKQREQNLNCEGYDTTSRKNFFFISETVLNLSDPKRCITAGEQDFIMMVTTPKEPTLAVKRTNPNFDWNTRKN